MLGKITKVPLLSRSKFPNAKILFLNPLNTVKHPLEVPLTPEKTQFGLFFTNKNVNNMYQNI